MASWTTAPQDATEPVVDATVPEEAADEAPEPAVPAQVLALAGGMDPELIWQNELGGLTYRMGERFVKWNPHRTGIPLEREARRLEWISQRHPAPRVLEFGADHEAEWLLTAALPGGYAVGDLWRTRSAEAIAAIATGLRAMHALPVDAFPGEWREEVWVERTPANLGARPLIVEPVIVHGDACAPNTLIADDGAWTGNVDFGDLGVGDRWADLAVAAMSLEWNFGEGHDDEFYAAYGIEPDPERIRYYRALWDQES
jgi:kanamycin kinase